MKFSRYLTVFLITAALAGIAISQGLTRKTGSGGGNTGTPTKPPAAVAAKPAKITDSVLAHIPADALAYVVVNDLDKTNKSAQKFLNQIGFGMMLPPGGPRDILKAH